MCTEASRSHLCFGSQVNRFSGQVAAWIPEQSLLQSDNWTCPASLGTDPRFPEENRWTLHSAFISIMSSLPTLSTSLWYSPQDQHASRDPTTPTVMCKVPGILQFLKGREDV